MQSVVILVGVHTALCATTGLVHITIVGKHIQKIVKAQQFYLQ